MSIASRAKPSRRALFVSKDPNRVDWFKDRLRNHPDTSLQFRFEVVDEGRELDFLKLGKGVQVIFIDLTMVANQSHFDLLSEVTANFHGPVVAVGNMHNLGEVQRCFRAGATDYLDTTNFESDFLQIEDRLGATSQKASDEGKLVLIVSCNGGNGKSTIAVNLAAAIDLQHKIPVGIAEFDFDNSDVAGMMSLEPDFTIADLLTSDRGYDLQMFTRALSRYKETGIEVLTTPSTLHDHLDFEGEGLVGIVEQFRAKFPITIIDMPHGYTRIDQQIIDMSDVVLVVIKLNYLSIRNTMKFLKFEIQKRAQSASKFQVVVNRRGQPYEVSLADAESTLNTKLDWILPNDPKVANLSINVGVPIVEEQPKSSLGIAFFQLSDKLMARLELAKSEAPKRAGLSRLWGLIESG